MSYRTEILPSTIVKFYANYLEDNGEPTKKRSHLVMEIDKIKKELGWERPCLSKKTAGRLHA